MRRTGFGPDGQKKDPGGLSVSIITDDFPSDEEELRSFVDARTHSTRAAGLLSVLAGHARDLGLGVTQTSADHVRISGMPYPEGQDKAEAFRVARDLLRRAWLRWRRDPRARWQPIDHPLRDVDEGT